jgi:hypothetical protein
LIVSGVTALAGITAVPGAPLVSMFILLLVSLLLLVYLVLLTSCCCFCPCCCWGACYCWRSDVAGVLGVAGSVLSLKSLLILVPTAIEQFFFCYRTIRWRILESIWTSNYRIKASIYRTLGYRTHNKLLVALLCLYDTRYSKKNFQLKELSLSSIQKICVDHFSSKDVRNKLRGISAQILYICHIFRSCSRCRLCQLQAAKTHLAA